MFGQESQFSFSFRSFGAGFQVPGGFLEIPEVYLWSFKASLYSFFSVITVCEGLKLVTEDLPGVQVEVLLVAVDLRSLRVFEGFLRVTCRGSAGVSRSLWRTFGL